MHEPNSSYRLSNDCYVKYKSNIITNGIKICLGEKYCLWILKFSLTFINVKLIKNSISDQNYKTMLASNNFRNFIKGSNYIESNVNWIETTIYVYIPQRNIYIFLTAFNSIIHLYINLKSLNDF